ncbi:MAG: hypothetical protein IJ737_03125 [Ruminococcus sp.]|nr:hypothetical protein [Ruminococcus sp.]
MNSELLAKMGELALSCVIIMGLIVLACLVTPRIARWIEKKNPELVKKIDPKPEERDPESYEAHSAFEASKIEGFDPNYKIYHGDIYGWGLKKKDKSKNKKEDGVEQENGKEQEDG